MFSRQFSLPKVSNFEYQSARALGLLWFLGVLGIFLFYPPYWALMDDHAHLLLAEHGFNGQNLWQYVIGFVQSDLGWGMFRPLYAVFIYLFYGLFKGSSQIAYLFIFFVNTVTFWVWAVLFERCIGKFLSVDKPNDIKIYRWLFFVFCFLFSPNYTLFFFASLQERLLLLFGSLAFYGFVRLLEEQKIVFWPTVFFSAGTLFALLSKATAIFFLLCFFELC